MHHVPENLRIAARHLMRSPGFTATVIGTLAVSIGAATALFTVVNAVVIRSLPYAEPDRLVLAWERRIASERDWGFTSRAHVRAYRQGVTALDIASYNYNQFVLSGDPYPQRVIGAQVDGDVFRVLGARAQYGRGLVPEDVGIEPARIVVLGHRLWRERYGSDPAIIGRAVIIGDVSHEIVGVMPREFEFPRNADMPRDVELWTPAARAAAGTMGDRMRLVVMVGRLRSGATLTQAAAEARAVSDQLVAESPASNRDWDVRVVPLREHVSGPVRPALTLLLAAAIFLIVIASLNVAHLFSLRALGRSRAIAIRVALGGTTRHIVGLLATEVLLLVAVAGAVGLGISVALRRALLAFAPVQLPRRDLVAMDWRVVAFAVLVSGAVAIVCALGPAARVRHVDLRGVLNSASRATATRARRRGQGLLVLTEVALATVLVIVGAALLSGVWRLQAIDPGVDARDVLTASVSLTGARFNPRDVQVDFLDGYLRAVRRIPGVARASTVNLLPMTGGLITTGYQSAESGDGDASGRSAVLRFVTDDYFATVGQRLVAGRPIDDTDRASNPLVFVASEAFVRQAVRSGGPVGARFRFTFGMLDSAATYTLVGVVADTREKGPTHAPLPTVYVASRQSPLPYNNIVVKASAPPALIITAMRRALADIDPALALDEVSSLHVRVRSAFALQRFYMVVLGMFGAAGVLLVGMGVFGVLSHLVTAQTHAIGVRLALGATPRRILRTTLTYAARLALLGLLVGIALVIPVRVVVMSATTGVATIGPTSLVWTIIVLGATALLSAFGPAWRASRLSPMVALRSQ